ncbi:ABC transporter substrate-binding protein [Pseudoalteromonas sp. '520P1 No. 423']|uniref:substrate-binding periplasmic protein n=1 Tax=Pseudoalteromonas sp. '520P1 No. 423' TaxID=1690037 RepID=UPI0007514A9C|nr:transporter substrate-binding domain-containing protein [Pseudoalteromonas sp. '520P1 No. 423']
MTRNIPLLLIIMLFSCNVFSQKVTVPKVPQPLEVYANHIPPYSIIDNGEISGFSELIFRRLTEKTQYQVNYNQINWARAYKNITTEQYAVMLALSRIPKREALFHWVGKTGRLTPSIWCKSERAKEYNIMFEHDISNYTFAEVRGFRFHSYLESLDGFPKKNLQLTRDKDQAIGLLMKERVDFMAGDELVLRWRLKTLGHSFTDVSRVYQFNNTTNNLYIAMSKNTPLEIVNDFKQAYEELKTSGELANLHQAWLNKLNVEIDKKL